MTQVDIYGASRVVAIRKHFMKGAKNSSDREFWIMQLVVEHGDTKTTVNIFTDSRPEDITATDEVIQ